MAGPKRYIGFLLTISCTIFRRLVNDYDFDHVPVSVF